jgi:signal transduction histidine kinase
LGYAQQAQRMSRDPAIQQPLEVIERQARSCAATVKQMLSGAHTPQPQIRPIDLSDAVRQCVRLVMPVLHDTGIRTLDVSGCAPCPVLADPSLIEQVLFNLLSNAADAGAANLRLRLICGGQNGALEIEDDGEGFPPQILPLLFQPFVTGKSPGRGTGLGLYLCRSLLRSMGGEIDLVSTHPGATVLRITLSRPAGPTACGVHAGDELPCTDR